VIQSENEGNRELKRKKYRQKKSMKKGGRKVRRNEIIYFKISTANL
jgi:hypothetical protein